MIAVTTLVAVMLYLDRVCLSIVGEQIKLDQSLTEAEYNRLLSSFFWAYALLQLPAGWLGDRYGPRTILSIYLFFWSACTGAMGLVSGFTALLLLRLGCGIFEAGAYPLAAGIVRRWMPFTSRGMGSGVVAVGGRLGGAIAPMLTAWIAAGTVDGWRRPFIWYGAVGMVGAIGFWFWFRDRPDQHPAVNQAEADLIDSGVPAPTTPVKVGMPPVGAFLGDASLWLMSLVQFAANLAWVFIITLFPSYLAQVHQMPQEQRALYQSIPLYAGIVGMLLGGWVTDRAARSLGVRWGRAVPIIVTRLLVGLAYVLCLVFTDPLVMLLLMCLVAWATDMGNAPTWAYGQDVGGRYVGAVIGWANMWGNFGAALAPEVANLTRWFYPDDPVAAWSAVFLVFAGTQVVAALAALGVDASRPIRGTE